MNQHTPEITVIIPTRNRANVLAAALESHAAQRLGFRWEMIVVDNGSTDHTQQVLARAVQELPLIAVRRDKPGKSLCLNYAMQMARSPLMAFTDDDVRVSRTWLNDLFSASQAYPGAAVFCGPVVPVFPQDTPKWLQDHQFALAAFARFSPPLAEGLLTPQYTPCGPNFMVRAESLPSLRFRLDLGPSDAGNLMSEDTEFFGCARRLGHDFVYVPSARVFHMIRGELVQFASLYDRAFQLGRSMVIARQQAVITQKKHDDSHPESLRFSKAALANYYLGQLYELKRMSSPLLDVLAALRSLKWAGALDELSHGARECLQGHFGGLELGQQSLAG